MNIKPNSHSNNNNNHSNNNRNHRNLYSLLLPLTATLLCMLAIFILSAQPATESDGNSKAIVKQVVTTAVKLGGTDITDLQKLELIDKVNDIARELMHSAVYFVMGIFAEIAALRIFKKKRVAIFITFLFCVVYGISDEIHQLFVPGRSFQLLDLEMDAAGALAAIGLVMLTNTMLNRKKCH